MTDQPSRYTFNHFAFVFAPFWLGYHRLYQWIFVYFLFVLLMLAISSYFPWLSAVFLWPGWLEPLFILTYMVLLHGFFGFAATKLAALRQERLNEQDENGRPKVPLFSAQNPSFLSAILSPLIIGAFFLWPLMFTAFWEYNPSVSPGVYTYEDDRSVPEGQLDIRQPASYEKYNDLINLYFRAEEPIDGKSFRYELYFAEELDEEWAMIQEQDSNIFSGRTISMSLIDAERPETETGYYRLNVYLDDERVAETMFDIYLEQYE
ncbi:DUF2628 domain-containing protein [Salisediminibacterium halotolerans]|uniref:DUF2628 domain-containing protein n=1 Tax=Salisediminibacterium halotolerans TaxID=517425 RepID=UPI000EAEDB04|nr:DUF2628 domain-containing protein [Salisediminibacterium halotolerans]RLJ73271.1 uncharacterized protein DUF2628 [Actinophytocola xinjiangensis]RPE86693.1 uncharacterized protein DUF2628 [Salisediminibacterium halotolerans]TWG34068.1 uncharacterized protein DUF2628 [Salisediminibacterium halotolerans]GEL07583.1 hypothetical protein SHA02_09990 [Salisediminibacterium halotolerans]